MDDSWENGDDENGGKRGRAGLTDVIDPHGPGWKDSLGEALDYAWEEHRRGGAPPGVYKADIYVRGENPISGYRVILSP
jgi:hypothetical protein